MDFPPQTQPPAATASPALERMATILRRLSPEIEPTLSSKSVRQLSDATGATTEFIRRGTRILMESLPKSLSSNRLKPNILTTASGVLRFKKKMRERAEDAERRRLEAMSYATRHQHVLETYQIRAPSHGPSPKDEDESTRRLLVYPSSNLYKLWQLTLLGFIYYQVLAVPYTLAFDSYDVKPTNDYANLLTSLVFCLDVLLNFNTALRDPSSPDAFITDRRVIAWTYLTGWYPCSSIVAFELTVFVDRFAMDLISSVPVDLVMYWINASSNEHQLHFLTALKVARLPRLVKISRLSHVLELLRLPIEWQRWLLYSRYAHLIRLITLVLVFVVVVHMFACVWYGMVADDDWAAVLFNTNFDTVNPYLLSFYLALQTIVGQNQLFQSDREYSFSSCVILVGAVVMAVVFGNVAILISNFYDDHNRYRGKMESLFAGMQLLRLPNELQLRIHEYYEAMYARHGTLDGKPETFKHELSKNLRIEVELFLRMTMIVRTPLFRECSVEAVQTLVLRLRFQVYLPSDFVIVRGEVGHDMYFIESGSCHVTNTTIKRKATRLCPNDADSAPKVMGPGDYFGEIALLLNCKRTAHVQAVVFSELCVLSRDVFNDVTDKYTEDRVVIEQFITEKYDPAVLEEAVQQHEAGAANKNHEQDVIEGLRKLADRLVRVETLVLDLEERTRMQRHFHSMAHQYSNPHHMSGDGISPRTSHIMTHKPSVQNILSHQPSYGALLRDENVPRLNPSPGTQDTSRTASRGHRESDSSSRRLV
ncbi:hypothetical protein AC1031_018530 [Aphanomyces cochlioides]|nr:hypothetical protein AC1031_018530 [Aphanomyces cochlioides]